MYLLTCCTQAGPVHKRHPPARRHEGPGADVRAVRGGLQADQKPGAAHRQAAADLPGAGGREAEDRQVVPVFLLGGRMSG